MAIHLQVWALRGIYPLLGNGYTRKTVGRLLESLTAAKCCYWFHHNQVPHFSAILLFRQFPVVLLTNYTPIHTIHKKVYWFEIQTELLRPIWDELELTASSQLCHTWVGDVLVKGSNFLRQKVSRPEGFIPNSLRPLPPLSSLISLVSHSHTHIYIEEIPRNFQ